jgi:hypothetical protein
VPDETKGKGKKKRKTVQVRTWENVQKGIGAAIIKKNIRRKKSG